MAKRESKAKQHTRNLVGGMKQSNAQSKTPISTLYPKKVNVGYSKTSPAHMQKGTKTPSRSATPQKFLLAVSNPGTRPTAPNVVTNPANPDDSSKPTTDWANENRLSSFSTRADAWNTRHMNYREESNSFNTAKQSYESYISDLNTYNNATLPDWQARKNTYQKDSNTNVRKKSTYSKDVKKFLSGLSGKISYKKVSRTRGSRGTGNRPGGSR